jgi:transcriptional regulator with XRE-family HTH domain
VFVSADLSTGIGGFSANISEPAVRNTAPATAEAIQRLRAQSGLTWDEIGRAFGVSRRTVHAWATGSKLNQEHSARLSVLAQAVDRLDAGSPELTRAALHAPEPNGLSPYQSLIRSLAQPGNRREGFAPWELLGAQGGQDGGSSAAAES